MYPLALYGITARQRPCGNHPIADDGAGMGRDDKLDFGHLGGVAEGVGDALAEGSREFRSID